MEIDWEGRKEVVKIGRVLYGEYNEALRRSLKASMIGTTTKAEIDATALEEYIIFKSLKQAPFIINLDNVRRLTVPDAKRIYIKATEISGLSEEKKAPLEPSLGEQPSQTQALSQQ